MKSVVIKTGKIILTVFLSLIPLTYSKARNHDINVYYYNINNDGAIYNKIPVPAKNNLIIFRFHHGIDGNSQRLIRGYRISPKFLNKHNLILCVDISINYLIIHNKELSEDGFYAFPCFLRAPPLC